MKLTLETHFDLAFCISLTRRDDRRKEFVQDQMENWGVGRHFVDFFDAYDHPTSGHEGCSRSHRMLLKVISEMSVERVLVMEDDCSAITKPILHAAGFNPTSTVYRTFCKANNGEGTVNDRFTKLIPHVPKDYDVLYLGAGYGEPPISRVNEFCLRVGFMQTTSCYGITREFARKWTAMVDAGGDLDHHPGPIDNLFGSFAKEHRYYCLQPRLTFQRESKSDITGLTNSYLFSMTDTTHESLV